MLSKFPRVSKVLDWAEGQPQSITAEAEKGVYSVLSDFDVSQLSGTLYSVVQDTISDRLRMTKPQLAGDGRGLELWRMLVREHEQLDQPLVQRELQKQYAYPPRCKSAKELREQLPNWELLGRQLEIQRGKSLDDDFRVCALDQLIPEEYRAALDDKLDLSTYLERLNFVRHRLNLIQGRDLAAARHQQPRTSGPMDINALEELIEEAKGAGLEQAEDLLAALRKSVPGCGKGNPGQGPASAGTAGKGFRGECFVCGKAGHPA